MAAPDMDCDFQLFSPTQPRRTSQPVNLLFPDGGDNSQDWAQWMRWDDQVAESSNEQPQIPDLPPISQEPEAQSTTGFSHDISLDFANHQVDSFTAQDSKPAAQSTVNNTPATQAFNSSSVSPMSTGVSRKRKSSSDDDGSTVSGAVRDGRKMSKPKRPHNVIEKRYRANLNDKISELRDSVPALRLPKTVDGKSVDDDDAPSSKLNKASILSKATEYIRHLEIRNKRLEEENTALKNRMRQVDRASDQSLTSAASYSSPSNYTVSTESGASSSPSIFSHGEDIASDQSPSSLYPPEGLMKVPDSFKRMWESSALDSPYGESYIQSQTSDRESSGVPSGRRRSRFPNKYMVGALAGLMIFEGMGREEETESTAKGLLAVPLDFLKNYQTPSMEHLSAMFQRSWSLWHVRAAIHFLILAGLVVGSAFVVFVYLFNSQPRRLSPPSKSSPAPNTTSPFSFRRQAWLTSIQQVGVPRHSFFREWYAVTSRCFEYVLRCLLGWKLYSWATGITEEDEKGRVKTWDIAIDAQLAGGDLEISRSRLVLTVFAAGTLPCNPMRTMQKALHCRILLWRVGNPGSWSFHISNDASRAIARHQWERARKLQRLLPNDHPDALPNHLAALLAFESDDVMTDNITQRATNLTWNCPTREGTDDDEAFLDIVEEDPAIQSSLDALAAWWSSHLLQIALLRYFEASAGDSDAKKSRDSFKQQIKLALDVAPRLSAAHTRALAMNAIFLEQGRIENIGKVLSALPSDEKDKRSHASNFLDSSLPISSREEIAIAVRCAMIAAIFTARSTGDACMPPFLTIERASAWFNKLALDPVELTLLGFAAVYHLLHVLASDTDYLASSESSSPSTPFSEGSLVLDSADEADEPIKCQMPPQSIPDVGRVAAELIYWARNAYNPVFYGLTTNIVNVIEKECTALCDGVGINVSEYLEAKQSREHKRKASQTSQVDEQGKEVGSPGAPENPDEVDVDYTNSKKDDCMSQNNASEQITES